MSSSPKTQKIRVCGDCEAFLERKTGQKVTGHYCLVTGAVAVESQYACLLPERQILEAAWLDSLRRREMGTSG